MGYPKNWLNPCPVESWSHLDDLLLHLLESFFSRGKLSKIYWQLLKTIFEFSVKRLFDYFHIWFNVLDRKLPSGIAPSEKKQLSKSVQILSKLFWSAKSISVKNQVSYEQKLVKSIEIMPESLLSDLLTLFVLAYIRQFNYIRLCCIVM